MNMTLMPTNLLHLCDDIQEKIGKEIKYIRVQKDAKKRRDFMYKKFTEINFCDPYLKNISEKYQFINRIILTGIKRKIEEHMNPSLIKYIESGYDDRIMDRSELLLLWKTFHIKSNEIIKFYLNCNKRKSKFIINEIISEFEYDSDEDSSDEDSSDEED